MIFGIYDPPDSSIKPWPDLRVGTLVNATEFEYDKQFCGVGTFELYVPIGAVDTDKLALDRFLFCSDGYFIIKHIQYEPDSIKISGYDLNGLLLDRLTVAKTEDGRDKIAGSTEYIVKHFVDANCAASEDTARNFPGLSVKANKNRGIANDAASPRLEIVSDVISDILSAQRMGWRINAANLTNTNASNKVRFEFEVYVSADRTATGSRPKTFSYGFGNADAIKTENSIAGAKNTLYCELDDGTVQTYSPVTDNVGFGRTEEYADLGCELAELSVYADHEIAGRFAAVESVTLEHVDPSGFGDTSTLDGFDLGDIVTVVDNNANVRREALISAVKIKRTGENALDLSTEENMFDLSAGGKTHDLSITVGEARAKPLDRVFKNTAAVSSSVKSATGKIKAVSSGSINSRDRLISGNNYYVFTPVTVQTIDHEGGGSTIATGYGAELDFLRGTSKYSEFVMSDLFTRIKDTNGKNYVLAIGYPKMEFFDYKREIGFKIVPPGSIELGFGDGLETVQLLKKGKNLYVTGIENLYIDGKKVFTTE